ncbi:hypothetical protein ACWGE1_11905 [Streptomyces sp. NPDC054932]
MPTLLYYPMVRPPREVLNQALLYWDDIATVVPEDQATYEQAVSDELKELRQRGLYHPLTAGTVRSDWGDVGLLSVLTEELRRLARRPPGAVDSVMDAPLYQSKVGRILEQEIVELGLGRRLEPSTVWPRRSLVVTREVRHIVIGAIAQGVAARARDRAYTLYTDQQSVQETLLRAPRGGMEVGAWRVELGRLLPTPAPSTSTAEVLAFRDRYADERERLMSATQTMLNGLCRDWEHPADILQRLGVELARARDDYESAARSSRMAWVSRSVSVTMGVASAAAGALVFPDMAWVAGIVGSLGFNIATREVRPQRRVRDGHPFSYLHHVDRELA